MQDFEFREEVFCKGGFDAAFRREHRVMKSFDGSVRTGALRGQSQIVPRYDHTARCKRCHQHMADIRITECRPQTSQLRVVKIWLTLLPVSLLQIIKNKYKKMMFK